MSPSWKRSIGVLLIILVLMGITYVHSPRTQPVEIVFVNYTNTPAGGLAAMLEIRNRSKDRIARNSCRISPEPAGDVGYWYAADVPSHRLDPGETERLMVAFAPIPMTHWRAEVIYVRNPTELEVWAMRCVDWLRGRGWAPTALREWRGGLASGQVSTDRIAVPAHNLPNQLMETNRRPAGQSGGR